MIFNWNKMTIIYSDCYERQNRCEKMRKQIFILFSLEKTAFVIDDVNGILLVGKEFTLMIFLEYLIIERENDF